MDTKSQISEADSHTAQDYIQSQLQLELDAKEALPYQFDTCTRPLGPLRQTLFSCLTCNPPPESQDVPYTPAGVCYSCSISCHCEHTLVELFSKRDFECDCGTTKLPADMPCSLRTNNATNLKGNVTGETPRLGNKYNQNFEGRFCACGEVYDPAKEKGTMFQCLGVGSVEEGGCGEDWWHPECLMGLPRNPHGARTTTQTTTHAQTTENDLSTITEEGVTNEAGIPTATQPDDDEAPLPPGFPAEDDFEHLICYKCVDKHPWIKQYAGTTGFLPPVFVRGQTADAPNQEQLDITSNEVEYPVVGAKRKAEDEDLEDVVKRAKVEDKETVKQEFVDGSGFDKSKHEALPVAPTSKMVLFLKDDFREHFCKCPECFPHLKPHPQLLEEEEPYEPPMSESDNGEGAGSVGSRSLLERGEAALSNMDRMRAIEGVMAYNHLKDKVKSFLQPFAESGQAVGAEDIKAYFAKLRGDDEAMRQAAASADGAHE